MPAEPRYELVLSRPPSVSHQAVQEQGSLVPRAALAAALSPVLTYWLPSRAAPWLAEQGFFTDYFSWAALVAAMVLVGAYTSVVAAMRLRRISELAAPLTPIEELLVALLGILMPTVPLWFGVSEVDLVPQSVAIQAGTVFIAVLALGGAMGEPRRLPPLMVGTIQPPRELAVRAMTAALLPVAVLLALLPAMVLDSIFTEADADPGRRILITWVAATVLGVAVGLRAWRSGAPALLSVAQQTAITVAAMVLAVAVWGLAGGFNAPRIAFLVQPPAILVGIVLLATRSGGAAPAVGVAPAPVVRGLDEPLLIPPSGAIFIGRTETPHHDPGTGRSETRIEARWLFLRPFALVTSEYRDRHGLQVRRDSPMELVMTRPGPSPAAVRLTAQPSGPVGPDFPPPSPRTEVRVRVAVRT